MPAVYWAGIFVLYGSFYLTTVASLSAPTDTILIGTPVSFSIKAI